MIVNLQSFIVLQIIFLIKICKNNKLIENNKFNFLEIIKNLLYLLFITFFKLKS